MAAAASQGAARLSQRFHSSPSLGQLRAVRQQAGHECKVTVGCSLCSSQDAVCPCHLACQGEVSRAAGAQGAAFWQGFAAPHPHRRALPTPQSQRHRISPSWQRQLPSHLPAPVPKLTGENTLAIAPALPTILLLPPAPPSAHSHAHPPLAPAGERTLPVAPSCVSTSTCTWSRESVRMWTSARSPAPAPAPPPRPVETAGKGQGQEAGWQGFTQAQTDRL